MSSTFELPALRGDDALGYLAGLGVLRLCTTELGDASARLGWPAGPWAGAQLSTTTARSVDELAEQLFGVASGLRKDGRLLPGVDGLPIEGAGSDPMNRRLSIEDGAGLATTARSVEDRAFGSWLRALLATSGFDAHKDDPERLALSLSPLFDAGPGTVHVARTLARSLADVVGPVTLRDGMARWRRVDTVGAYLDHRADREKATGPSPRSGSYPKYGEPGATWLALMATPLFEMRGDERSQPVTVGWFTRPRRFCWPVWSAPLGVAAVTALLDHPAVRAAGAVSSGGRSKADDDRLTALDAVAVYRADRQMAGNYAAALGPARRLWPALG